MGTKRADPRTSEGARLERAAFRRTIRRRLKALPQFVLASHHENGMRSALEDLLSFVEGRRSRYDARPGGLGRR